MDAAPTPPPARRGRLTRTHLWLLVLVVSIVALDRLAKEIVANSIERGDAWPSDDWPIRLVHVINTGAAFGMLQDTGPLLAILGVIGVAVIVAYLVAPGLVSSEFVDWRVQVGLTLMLGGALGNLLDRLAGQGVVDFVKFPNFPAFNVADSAITIGVLALLWGFLRPTEESPPAAASSEASSRSELDGSTR